MLRHTNNFQSRYHMSEPTFNKLVRLLRDDVTVDEIRSRASTEGNAPIYPELIAGAGLRFLGGADNASISEIFGISDSSTLRIINMFLNAVIGCDALSLVVPVSHDALLKGAHDFNNISGCGLYFGVVGAIDGWLCCTDRPSDVTNATDYYSGHYQRFGINVQAMCDANLRFIYVGTAAPGSTNDNRAFSRCLLLRRWIDTLSNEFFIIGDGAYVVSNRILIPYSGAQKHTTYKRTYNFYLSQLRIRIEMAFGRLTTKWRIFRRNLNFSTNKNSQIVQVACRLHNFVINNDNIAYTHLNQNSNLSQWQVDPLDDGPEYNRGYLSTRPARPVECVIENSRRTLILNEIVSSDIRRPDHNKKRNRELDYDTDYDD